MQPFLELTTVAVFGACIGSFVACISFRISRSIKAQINAQQPTQFIPKPAQAPQFGSPPSSSSSSSSSSPSIQKPSTKPECITKILCNRSACPNCNRQLRAIELIPILSYIALKGRCRGCNAKISPKYAITEAITTALILLLYVISSGILPFLLALGMLIAFAIITAVDLETMMIPHALIAISGLCVAGLRLLEGIPSSEEITSAAIAMLVIVIFKPLYEFTRHKITLQHKEVIGAGDIKLLLVSAMAIKSIDFSFFTFLLGSSGVLFYSLRIAISRLCDTKQSATKGGGAFPFAPAICVTTLFLCLKGLDAFFTF